MTARKSPLQTDIFSLISENLALPQTVAGQTDGILKAQAEFLSGMEEIARDWLQRRRQGNEIAIQAAEKIFSCKDPSEMMVAYFDWLGGAMRRLSEEATALSEGAFAVTASATKAGGNGAAASAPRAKPAKAKAKAKGKSRAKAKAKAKPALHPAPEPAQPAAKPVQRLAS